MIELARRKIQEKIKEVKESLEIDVDALDNITGGTGEVWETRYYECSKCHSMFKSELHPPFPCPVCQETITDKDECI